MRWAIVGLVLLAGCTTETASHTTPNNKASAPAPPVTPPAAKNVVGDTITTTAGNSYTVVEYVDHFASTNEFDKPPVGGFFAAISVKACAGKTTLDANPASFELVEPDDSRLQETPVAGGKTPAFNYASLQPGECVSGWVNYAALARPKTILLANSDLRWTVP